MKNFRFGGKTPADCVSFRDVDDGASFRDVVDDGASRNGLLLFIFI